MDSSEAPFKLAVFLKRDLDPAVGGTFAEGIFSAIFSCRICLGFDNWNLPFALALGEAKGGFRNFDVGDFGILGGRRLGSRSFL